MAASSSLLLPSLSPQIPAIASKPKTLTLALSHSTTPVSSPKPFSLSWSASNFFPVLRKSRTFGSSIARNVAVSSEFEQEEVEEEEELSSGEEVDFSPDLKLFVGNLPFSVDSAQLAGLFESAGNVEMVEVIYDKLTGKSRGFGFVTMSTVKEVEAAAQQFNGYTLEGRVLRVNSGPPPPKDDLPSRGFRTGDNFNAANRGYRTGDSFNAANRVYVGNLPWSVDNLALETLFSEQGKVMDAKVVYDRDSGRSRGFGFVSYSSEEEVKNAIASLNGVDMDGRSIRVTAAEARPRRQF